MSEFIEKLENLRNPIVVDIGGLNCPLPLLRTKKQLEKCKTGEVVQLTGIKENFVPFLKAWCERNNHLVSEEKINYGKITFFIKKG